MERSYHRDLGRHGGGTTGGWNRGFVHVDQIKVMACEDAPHSLEHERPRAHIRDRTVRLDGDGSAGSNEIVWKIGGSICEIPSGGDDPCLVPSPLQVLDQARYVMVDAAGNGPSIG